MRSGPLRFVPFVCLGLGALFLFFATAIYVIDSDLISFFVPARMVSLNGALVAALLLGISAWLRRTRPMPWTKGLLVFSLIAAAVVYVREYALIDEVELSFNNAGAELVGTLYLPASEAPHPAVVIAHGSLKAPREAYHLFASGLTRQGIAVFSFDKRGTGKSGGEYQEQNNASEENLKLLASDVASAAEVIADHPSIDARRLGVFGISMGGWLAPIAAEETGRIRFMVLNSGPTVFRWRRELLQRPGGRHPRRRIRSSAIRNRQFGRSRVAVGV